MLGWYSHRNRMGMGWDGIGWKLFSCPTTSYHPFTITQLSDTSTIPYHPPQLLPSHPTHHDKTSYTIPIPSQYHPIRITSVPCTYQHNSRNLLTDVQNLLKFLRQEVQKRGLGRALDDVEKICLLLDPSLEVPLHGRLFKRRKRSPQRSARSGGVQV